MRMNSSNAANNSNNYSAHWLISKLHKNGIDKITDFENEPNPQALHEFDARMHYIYNKKARSSQLDPYQPNHHSITKRRRN